MTYNGISSVVKLIDKVYTTGVTLTSLEMEQVEKKIICLKGLEEWSIRVPSLL